MINVHHEIPGGAQVQIYCPTPFPVAQNLVLTGVAAYREHRVDPHTARRLLQFGARQIAASCKDFELADFATAAAGELARVEAGFVRVQAELRERIDITGSGDH